MSSAAQSRAPQSLPLSSTTSGATPSARGQRSLQRLRQAPLFAGVPEEVLAGLGARAHRACYTRGAALRDAEAPDALFVVGRGALRLVRVERATVQEITLLLVGAGQFFWFVSRDHAGLPRGTAMALQAGTEVYRLSYDHVFTMLEGYPTRLRKCSTLMRSGASTYIELLQRNSTISNPSL